MGLSDVSERGDGLGHAWPAIFIRETEGRMNAVQGRAESVHPAPTQSLPASEPQGVERTARPRFPSSDQLADRSDLVPSCANAALSEFASAASNRQPEIPTGHSLPPCRRIP